MEKKNLRQLDFITSIVLLVFGLFVIYSAFQMPMKDSYGGVESVWYVSPALMPLFIGFSTLLLGFFLLLQAIKDGGASHSIKGLIEVFTKDKDITLRVLVVILSFVGLIYIYIPRIDFFLSIMLFLFYISSAFYPDNKKVLKNMTVSYLVGTGLLLLMTITGMGAWLVGLFSYTLDILVLAFFIILNVQARKEVKAVELSPKLITTVTWVSILTPLVLCPIFRYALLTPLPYEGGIIKLMNLVYYSIKY